MNLRERRALKAFQDDVLPTWTEKLNAAAQKELTLEFDWEKLGKNEAEEDNDWSHMYAEAWPRVYLEPIELALNDITADDMGKEALHARLNKVHFTNSGQYFSGESAYSLDGDTLVVDHQPFANQDDVGLRHVALRNLLESSL